MYRQHGNGHDELVQELWREDAPDEQVIPEHCGDEADAGQAENPSHQSVKEAPDSSYLIDECREAASRTAQDILLLEPNSWAKMASVANHMRRGPVKVIIAVKIPQICKLS